MIFRRTKIRAWLLPLLLLAPFSGSVAQQPAWPEISERSTAKRYLGISGLALWQDDGRQTSFIIAHDAKTSDGDVPRIGILTIRRNSPATYVRLAWPRGHALSNDLEAIAAIPDRKNEFLALTSSGQVYHLAVTVVSGKPRLSIIKQGVGVTRFPPGGNLEGFAIQHIGDSLVAVWADRGSGARLAQLIADRFDPVKDAFSQHPISLGYVRVEYPAGDCVRHISDVKIDPEGNVFVSAARDCDDKNARPFQSAVYRIGNLVPGKGDVRLELLGLPELLFKSDLYKIEALEFMPGKPRRFIFGTDDELDGGAFWVQP